ncbi:hypothetical protein B0O95_104149 [Mycetohabitans endofungorum]|uniref:Uncharacterized protein n=1 Tax=Mycetohabitans endofungorum TaxID=417203 RepID=A0A2P5KBV7_9BURK|nr:hypothetical protein B0O95_104149 [Mycetohabitans endofungorum]
MHATMGQGHRKSLEAFKSAHDGLSWATVWWLASIAYRLPGHHIEPASL